MNEVAVLEVGSDPLWVVNKIAAPVMLAGLSVGLVIALFLALTNIQEMTLTFVPKIIMIFFAVILFLPFMMTSLREFSLRLFDRMVSLG
ncbi:MAG: flagellar biosynthetic protein FliQ [Proteobacteria bacterium]|nr:flagellar biosynthetic protein FliQ [Pseudomonadota bacterium]